MADTAVTPDGAQVDRTIAAALLTAPAFIALEQTIAATPQLKATFREAKDRFLFLDDPHRARLAAWASDPRLRALLEITLDRQIFDFSLPYTENYLTPGATVPTVPEVVIGAGLHAAIYVSAKMMAGGVLPLVLDERRRAGGLFGIAVRPAFYLNSRNRVESRSGPRRPGMPGPLNSLVDAVLQPSDIDFAEYSDQTTLGLVARVALAIHRRVVLEQQVVSITRSPGYYQLQLASGARIFAQTVVCATGPGKPLPPLAQHPRLWNFETFIEKVGSERYPFRDIKKVAVIGAGDSGRVAVEALLGQGPLSGGATLDYIPEITWFGQQYTCKEDFQTCERSRYAGIGRAMYRAQQPDYYYRLYAKRARVAYVLPEANMLRVIGERGQTFDRFDLVIDCRGLVDMTATLFEDTIEEEDVKVNDRVVARKLRGEKIYKVGPAARLAVTPEERSQTPALESIPDNSLALFRYSELTSLFARMRTREESPTVPEPPIIQETKNGYQTIRLRPLPLPDSAVHNDITEALARQLSLYSSSRRFTLTDDFLGYDYLGRSRDARRDLDWFRFFSDPYIQTIIFQQQRGDFEAIVDSLYRVYITG